MAEEKNSFILYCDWADTFEALPDDVAGQLIKHIFSYVNDEEPDTENILIKAVFANIKNQLKRDLSKWYNQKNKNTDSGYKSALAKFKKKIIESTEVIDFNAEIKNCVKKKEKYLMSGKSVTYWDECIKFLQSKTTKSTLVESVATQANTSQHKPTKSTVNVTVTDTVTDILLKKETKKISKEINIPSYDDFLCYALEKRPNVDKEHVRLKFESWKEANWYTSGEKPRKIKNWKTTLLNSLPYLKEKSSVKKEKVAASTNWEDYLKEEI